MQQQTLMTIFDISNDKSLPNFILNLKNDKNAIAKSIYNTIGHICNDVKLICNIINDICNDIHDILQCYFHNVLGMVSNQTFMSL